MSTEKKDSALSLTHAMRLKRSGWQNCLLLTMQNKPNLSSQFEPEEDDLDEYDNVRIHKNNRKSSSDRHDKKKIRKFSKYDY